MILRRKELESVLRGGTGGDISSAFELLQIYIALNENQLASQLVNNMLSANMPAGVTLQLTQMLVDTRRSGLAERAMMHYLKQKPDDLRMQVELAALRLSMGRTGQALSALEVAVEKGGESIRSLLRRDARFNPLRNEARFQKLIPPANARNLPFGAAPVRNGLGGLSL